MIEFRKRLLPVWLTGILLTVAMTVATSGAQAQSASSATQETALPAKSAQAKTQAKEAPSGKPAGSSPVATPAEQPNTVILSEKLRYDDIKKTSVFTGKVIMTRGLMTLHSDELQMREDAQGNQYGTALASPGKMVTVRQERPENYEVIEGVGRRAEYDGTRNTFDLIGQAVVTRFICGKPFDTIRGQKIRYNEKTSIYEAIGGPESATPDGRVRSVMEPRARTDAAAAECQKQQGAKQAAGKGSAPKNSKAAGPGTTSPPVDRNGSGNIR